MREDELYYPIGRFLKNRGYAVAYEVPQRPGSARKVDVVGVKPKKGIAVAVEAKLNHYSRALEQASLRLLISDFVYVSFPEEYAKLVYRTRKATLECAGIGLISVNGYARELILPKKSIYVNPDRRSTLIDMVRMLRKEDV